MEETRTPRVYEIGYLVLPTLGEEGAFTTIEALKSQLGDMGAEMISEEAPALIDLAYDMTKVIDNKRTIFETACFGWVKFAINPEAIADITNLLDEHEDLLRYLLIKTVREDTIVKKPVAKKEIATPESHKTDMASEESSSEEKKPVDEEQLAEALDDLDTKEEASEETTETEV